MPETLTREIQPEREREGRRRRAVTAMVATASLAALAVVFGDSRTQIGVLCAGCEEVGASRRDRSWQRRLMVDGDDG